MSLQSPMLASCFGTDMPAERTRTSKEHVAYKCTISILHWSADRMHSHGFLDDACQVCQLVQVSIVRAPGVGLLGGGQQAMLPQLSHNLLLHLQHRHGLRVDPPSVQSSMPPFLVTKCHQKKVYGMLHLYIFRRLVFSRCGTCQESSNDLCACIAMTAVFLPRVMPQCCYWTL